MTQFLVEELRELDAMRALRGVFGVEGRLGAVALERLEDSSRISDRPAAEPEDRKRAATGPPPGSRQIARAQSAPGVGDALEIERPARLLTEV